MFEPIEPFKPTFLTVTLVSPFEPEPMFFFDYLSQNKFLKPFLTIFFLPYDHTAYMKTRIRESEKVYVFGLFIWKYM